MAFSLMGQHGGQVDSTRDAEVILRRVERVEELLQAGTDLSLTEVAAHAGFHTRATSAISSSASSASHHSGPGCPQESANSSKPRQETDERHPYHSHEQCGARWSRRGEGRTFARVDHRGRESGVSEPNLLHQPGGVAEAEARPASPRDGDHGLRPDREHEEKASRSFLLILLRALGAMHT